MTAPSHQEYEDDFEEEQEEEEDDYGDDDFEDDESEPPTPKPKRSGSVGGESDVARAVREENERAVRLKTSETIAPSGLSTPMERNAGTTERKVKGMPIKGLKSKRLTDAQRRAATFRIKRWKLVNAAVGVTQSSEFSVFSSAPMTLRQMHDASIGPYANRRYATTQTGGDGESRTFETQTEGGDKRNVRAQAPDDLGVSREDLEAASDSSSSSKSAALVRREMAAEKVAKWARATGELQHSREKRLAGFVARAGGVCDALLHERRVVPNKSKDGSTASVVDLMRARTTGVLKAHAVEGQLGSLTSAYMALDVEGLTTGRRVTACAFESNEGRSAKTLCVAYDRVSEKGKGVDGRGLLLVWDLSANEKNTKHAMTLEGSPTCVTWGGGVGHGEKNVLVCGTNEGALCAWDLRENEQSNFNGEFGDENEENENVSTELSDATVHALLKQHGLTSFRRPSYSTEGVGFFGEGDDVSFGEPGGSLVSVRVCEESGGDEKEKSSLDFHVLTLCADGTVDAHFVSELPKREAEDAALQDLGLRFGSRVRITRVSGGVSYGGKRGNETSSRGNCLRVVNSAKGACEFFVADEGGGVLRGARYGAAPLPRSFATCDVLDAGSLGSRHPNPLPAVSLDFNPLFGNDESDFHVFLAAHKGGGVALYKSNHSLALRVWDAVSSGNVVAVRWSTSRPSMFFVLDDNCVVFAFDLLSHEPQTPAHFEAFGAREKITAFEVAATGDFHDQGQHLMCLGYDDGRVDVHAMAQKFATVTQEEVKALRAMINE